MYHLINALSAVVFLAYNGYVFRYVFRKRAYYSLRRKRMLLHTLSGILTMCTGTYGITALLLGGTVDPRLVHVWSVGFLWNNLSGFVLIPKLTALDPATKREFISLFLVQVIFWPVVYGIVYPEWTIAMQWVSGALLVLGLVTSVTNTALYLLDWREGKSVQLVAGKKLVKAMERANEAGSIYDHYVSILFRRGSHQTRMPANKRMIAVALSIVLPFLLLAVITYRMPTMRTHAAYSEDYNWYTLLLFGTVGNAQVFHGTMSVRGIDKVHRTTNMVLGTTALELVTLVTFLLAKFSPDVCLESMRMVVRGR